MKKRVLRSPVKAEYFYQIKWLLKFDEYRLKKEYWRKRLEGKEYDEVHITLGYPKADDAERILVRPWRGYHEKQITHKEFGNEPVDVYAIRVN